MSLYYEGLDQNTHGQYEKALESLNQSLAINPGSSEVWLAKSAARFNLRRLDEALVAADRSLDLDERNTEAWRMKTEILKAWGNVKDD